MRWVGFYVTFWVQVIMLGCSLPTYGSFKQWNCNKKSGNWEVGSNWIPEGQPVNGDSVTLSCSGLTVTYDANTTVDLSSLTVEGGITLSQNSGILKTSTESVGDSDSGKVIQSGGTHTVDSILNISHGGDGTYQLQDGTLNTSSLNVGSGGALGGKGTFILSGGIHTNTFTVTVGQSSEGNYELQGGTLNTSSLHIGYGGEGAFIQSGGTHTSSSEIRIGEGADAATYELSDGSLKTQSVRVGASGPGTFTQGGGTHEFRFLDVTKDGTYNLSEGDLKGGVRVNNEGTFNYSGGTITADADLNNSGTLSLDGSRTITGNFTQNADGRLFIDLNSPSAFDRLTITRNATLGGHIRVDIGTFDPPAGARFDILTANSISGFDVNLFELPRLSGLKEFRVTLAGNGSIVRLSVVSLIAPDVPSLINAINNANASGKAATIFLGPGYTYGLTLVNNATDDGPNGLPSIIGNITIEGNGAAITRSTNTAFFRIFHVAVGGHLSLNNLSVRNGLVIANGAGILNRGTLQLTNSTVSGNWADSYSINGSLSFLYGGGIFNAGTAKLTNSTVSNNLADFRGGGIYNAGSLTLTNSTISSNTLYDYFGGGIFNDGTAKLTNSTITRNSAPRGGGGIENNGTVGLINTIVANQARGGDCGVSLGQRITSQGHNLDSDGSCVTDGVNQDITADSMLGPLGNYGGPTQTHALLPGSRAIDAGDNSACPDADQRGLMRNKAQGCDIGAYELVAIRVTTINVDGRLGDGTCSLIEAINEAQTPGYSSGDCQRGIPGPNIIELVQPGPYLLTKVNNNMVGPNGLPSIRGQIIINGKGAIIERSDPAPEFRIFQVAPGGNLTLQGVTVRNGQSSRTFDSPAADGGCIWNGGMLQLTNSTVSGCRAGENSGNGGGLFNSDGTTKVNNSTLSDNIGVFGGAVFNIDGKVTLTNSTIGGNSSAFGGGILNTHSHAPGGTVTLINTTVSENTAGQEGSGIRTDPGDREARIQNRIDVINSIVANNKGEGGDCSDDVQNFAIISNKGNNMDSDGTCRFTTTVPGLEDFIDPGTSGKGRFPLAPDSHALDAGDNNTCPSTDQLGHRRPVDSRGFKDSSIATCDIGAIEFYPNVNQALFFVRDPLSYTPTENTEGCPSGFEGKFSFNARLQGKAPDVPPLSHLFVQVNPLTTPGYLLQNADGGAGGVGAVLTVEENDGYSDGMLEGTEFVDVAFTLCVPSLTKPFSLFVDVFGNVRGTE